MADPEAEGAGVRRAREAVGLSREDLGALLGVSQRTVESWEVGAAVIPREKVHHIKTALGGLRPKSAVGLININVRLSADLLSRVDDKAAAEDRSRSQMVRLLVERGLQ